jgi:hypothetical protein
VKKSDKDRQVIPRQILMPSPHGCAESVLQLQHALELGKESELQSKNREVKNSSKFSFLKHQKGNPKLVEGCALENQRSHRCLWTLESTALLYSTNKAGLLHRRNEI